MIFRDGDDGVEFDVKVVPGSSRTGLAGPLGDAIKINVAAPPEKGKANRAVVKLLALVLDVPGRQIAIVTGASTPRKTIRITGTTAKYCHGRILTH